jgi:hypothetical protein
MNAFEGRINYTSFVVLAEEVASKADMHSLLVRIAAMPFHEKVRRLHNPKP